MEETAQSTVEQQPITLAELVRATRLRENLSQEDLAGSELNAAFIQAVEMAGVRPSNVVLQLLAQRLNIPLAVLQAAPAPLSRKIDLEAVAVDLQYQSVYLLLLIRTDRAEEALALIAEAEQNAAPYLDKLPAQVAYLSPFLRARAFYQQGEKRRCQQQLEKALEIAQPDAEAATRVHNLLGATLYTLEEPQPALEQHLKCLPFIELNKKKQQRLAVSVYENLAHEYNALKKLSLAIDAYKMVLQLLKDVDDPVHEAAVYWGLMVAYRGRGEFKQAKFYGLQALNIYERVNIAADAAQICGNLAEIMTEEGLYEEAEQLLAQAEQLGQDLDNSGLNTYLWRDRAEIALKRGQLDLAAKYIVEAICFAEEYLSRSASERKQVVEHPHRVHAEALETAARIEEAKGATKTADQLFESALAEINETSLTESIEFITLSYADILTARGEHERAVEQYYRLARRIKGR